MMKVPKTGDIVAFWFEGRPVYAEVTGVDDAHSLLPYVPGKHRRARIGLKTLVSQSHAHSSADFDVSDSGKIGPSLDRYRGEQIELREPTAEEQAALRTLGIIA